MTVTLSLAGLLIVVGLAALARRSLVVVTVTGVSMEPTLFGGDRVLIRRAGGHPQRGDLIVLELPGDTGGWERTALGAAPLDGRHLLVKRVVALAGDRTPPGSVPQPAAPLVPPGTLVVVGDNRRRSLDSRRLGFIPAERVVGVVVRQLASRT